MTVNFTQIKIFSIALTGTPLKKHPQTSRPTAIPFCGLLSDVVVENAVTATIL